MTVQRVTEDGTLRLEGDCSIEEAETLLELLLTNAEAPVDWSRCRSMHTAVVQVLLALRSPLLGMPEDPFLRRWIGPLLSGGAAAEAGSRGNAAEMGHAAGQPQTGPKLL